MLFSIPTIARSRSLRGQQFLRRKLSNHNPKPGRTLQNSQSRRRSHPEKPKEKNEQHLCCAQHIARPKTNPLGVKQFIKPKSCEQHPKPRRTLQKQPNKKTKSPRKKNKKQKRAAFRAVLTQQSPEANPEKHAQNSLPPTHLTRRERCKTLRAEEKKSAQPRWTYPKLYCCKQTTKQPPNRPEHWRKGQGRCRGRGLPQGNGNNDHSHGA